MVELEKLVEKFAKVFPSTKQLNERFGEEWYCSLTQDEERVLDISETIERLPEEIWEWVGTPAEWTREEVLPIFGNTSTEEEYPQLQPPKFTYKTIPAYLEKVSLWLDEQKEGKEKADALEASKQAESAVGKGKRAVVETGKQKKDQSTPRAKQKALE